MIPAQILLVTGFLGAGKTTLINRILHAPSGRRIAAVVNDFGAINIDAALLSSTGKDGVMKLTNGCICCTLQGDLLRTLSTLMGRDPQPEAIVIETSGISNPKDIIENLLDPVIFRSASLDTVATLIDAAALAELAALPDDRVWTSQIMAADLLIFSKTDLLENTQLETVRLMVRERFPSKHQLDARDDLPELLFGHTLHVPSDSSRKPRVQFPIDFETATWTCDRSLSLAGFQALLGELSNSLLRAKGFIEFVEMPGRPMLFQLVGTRATVVASPVDPLPNTKASLVLIARHGTNSLGNALARLDELAR